MRQIIVDMPIDVEIHYSVRKARQTASNAATRPFPKAAYLRSAAKVAKIMEREQSAALPWLQEMQRFNFNLPDEDYMRRHAPENTVPGDE